VQKIGDALAHEPPPSEDARWRLAHYLWQVRRFELGAGPLPQGPFEKLFAHSLQAAPSWKVVTVLQLFNALRALRAVLFGRTPLVTFLHPEWLDYRSIAVVLRATSVSKKNCPLYIGDGGSVLGRVLGSPAYTLSQVLDGTYDRNAIPPRSVDVTVVELSVSGLRLLNEVLAKLALKTRPGGRVVVFHRNTGELSTRDLKIALISLGQRVNAQELARISVTIVWGSPYRSWLREGFPLALSYVRKRTMLGLLKGTFVFAVVELLCTLMNLASLCLRSRYAPERPFSSLTITLHV
jgi:hypothetical protein